MRHFSVLALAALVLALGAFPVEGAVYSAIVTNTINTLDDSDADIGVHYNGENYVLSSSGLAVGDYLAAGVNIAEVERVGQAPLTITQFGVNALAILKVGSVSSAGTNSVGMLLSDFSFVAPTVSEWSGIVDDLLGGASALKKTTAGGLIVFYDFADADFARVSPPATLSGSADTIHTGAILLGEMGFTGLPDVNGNTTDNALGEGWIATGPTDPSVARFLPIPTGIPGTSFALAVNRLTGWDGLQFIQMATLFDDNIITLGLDGRADFVGGGTLVGYGDALGAGIAQGPWQIASDADISFFPVPEPTSLLLWCGLAGVAYFVWRRRK